MSLRFLTIAGALLVLIGGAVGWFVFMPRAPVPGGVHAVGRVDVTLTDSQGRPLPVTVWYPTTAPRNGAKSNGGGPLVAPPNAPLVLYSPGWTGVRTQSTIQTSNLASQGFIVVGCDDISSDPATDPDQGRTFEMKDEATTAASIERAGRHAVAQADRILEVLHALDAGKVSLLAGRVDLRRVGVLGNSIGGPSGLAAAAREPRIVAVFNLDGGLFGPAATEIVPPAYFLLSSLEAFPLEAELVSPDPYTRNNAQVSAIDLPRNRRRMKRPDSYWAQLPKAEHMDLGDALFAPPRKPTLRTNFERRAIAEAIESYQTAFFRSSLLGDEAPLNALVGRNDQIVRWISPTPPP